MYTALYTQYAIPYTMSALYLYLYTVYAVYTGQEFIRVVGFGSAVGLLHGKGVLENIQRERDAAAAQAVKNRNR